MAHPITPPGPRWDVFCRVVDNHGDAGVCWRLATQLAARGLAVRLVIDDPAPLAWMAPPGQAGAADAADAAGVQVLAWPGPADAADVVIEAFGCDPPPAYVQTMAARPVPPVWINLEYLSAEAYVERSHALPSPQQVGADTWLDKWFFYPGYTARTGGLLRETGLMAAREKFDRTRWLQGLDLALQPGERAVSLFCYDNAALPRLLQDLARQPTLLLLTPGHAQRQVITAPPGVRLARLPFLSQTDFDHLLWSCDLNVVRGEDSLVRAIWAGAPFVWQAYPQHDGVHLAKVEALLEQAALPTSAQLAWRAWNSSGALPWPCLEANPDGLASWQTATVALRERLLSHADLVTQLLAFVASKSSQVA
ncbi:MAG: elongation factor P maturation arginine rhamnosyltransferase EarP [Rubrivivax sp.]|nr:elongation factor P maturation arginine rhamnosyltransferase EarP [Rubrivivax sp.]